MEKATLSSVFNATGEIAGIKMIILFISIDA